MAENTYEATHALEAGRERFRFAVHTIVSLSNENVFLLGGKSVLALPLLVI